MKNEVATFNASNGHNP